MPLLKGSKSQEIDPAVEKALAKRVGHPLPWSDTELGKVTNLHVSHARDLSGLLRCPHLRILLLIGCDPVELEPLTALSSIVSLTIEDSGLRTLDGVTKFPLYTLDLGFNLLSDITPALEVRPLKRIDVTGNPLSPDSFHSIIPELRSRGVDVTASAEKEWRITHLLHEEGLPYSYYRDDQGKYRISRPGLAHTHCPEVNHPVIAPQDLRNLLSHDPADVPRLFDESNPQET